METQLMENTLHLYVGFGTNNDQMGNDFYWPYWSQRLYIYALFYVHLFLAIPYLNLVKCSFLVNC
jgi:hypothetical protein